MVGVVSRDGKKKVVVGGCSIVGIGKVKVTSCSNFFVQKKDDGIEFRIVHACSPFNPKVSS